MIPKQYDNKGYNVGYYGSLTQGWQCPICSRVYAPWVRECIECKKKRVVCGKNIDDNKRAI